MTPRGMTLLETVLALALLAGLATASVAWTTSAASSSQGLSAQASWESAAQATLRLIELDLTCGDVTHRASDHPSGPDWLHVDEDSLQCRVRIPPYTGTESVVYRFALDSGELTRTTDPAGAPASEAILLGDLASVEFALIADQPQSDAHAHVRMRLVSTEGWELERRLRLGDRWQP